MTDRLTVQDCRDAGYCVTGLRAACERHNQNFRQLFKEGLPLENLENIDDLSVKRAVGIARRRIERHGR